MGTKRESSGDPHNAAVAAQLKAKRYELAMSYPELEEKSGVKKATLIRVLFDRRAMRVADFFAIAKALNMDPLKVFADAERAVAEQIAEGKTAPDRHSKRIAD